VVAEHRVYSDLFSVADFVRQVAVSQGKNLLIDALREHFKQDRFFRFTTDAFGFPLTPDLTDMPPDIQEDRTTRVFIGDIFRYDKRYWPSLVVRHSSGRYKPVSFNQNVATTKYRVDLVLDGYGGRSLINVPTHHVVAGAWEQSFEILIASEGIPDREELTDIVSSFLIGKARQELYEAGLFVRSVSMSGEREEDWGNDKVFLQSITVETYSEWRREIPIDNLVETVNFCFKYGLFGTNVDDFPIDTTLIDIST
jgi:hypothetical protein